MMASPFSFVSEEDALLLSEEREGEKNLLLERELDERQRERWYLRYE